MSKGIGTDPEHWVRLPGSGVEVRGTKYPVYADARGTLGSVMAGTEYVGSTMETLRNYMMADSRRKQVKVSVPFSHLHTSTYGDRASVKHGEATGIHSGSGNVLIRWRDGKTEQAGGYSSTYVQPLDADESAEYIRLQKAKAAANKAFTEFEEAHKLQCRNGHSTGLQNVVREAIEDAQKELGEKEAAAS